MKRISLSKPNGLEIVLNWKTKIRSFCASNAIINPKMANLLGTQEIVVFPYDKKNPSAEYTARMQIFTLDINSGFCYDFFYKISFELF